MRCCWGGATCTWFLVALRKRARGDGRSGCGFLMLLIFGKGRLGFRIEKGRGEGKRLVFVCINMR